MSNFDFSFLDEKDFRAKYGVGPDQSRIRFYVGGIRCGKCVRRLEELPLTLPGLRALRVEMGKNLAHAEVDPNVLSFAQLARKISDMGFKPIPLTAEVSEEAVEREEDRAELIRLAVAGACAGNIMMFSFATYLGASGEMAPVFAWLSFALYLPVVFYVALPFYRGAWNSLRQRQLSVDLPMAVASLSGFIFSVVELLRGRNDVYFDSLSGFLFLILISRWTQKRMQRRFLQPQEILSGLQLDRVRRVTVDGWTWIPTEQLGVGERFMIRAPETVPAEAELVSSNAHFSMAWLSGESRSRTFLIGSVVPAGAQLLSGEALLLARKPLRETGFGQILEEVRQFTLSRNRIVTLADRWTQWLLATVFAVAVIYLIVQYPSMGEEAVRRALALVILACPCAMAFGTPLGLAAALRKAQRRGLIVRNANVFEKALGVRTVFFDKTGTLTETELELMQDPLSIPLVYRKIVLSLENLSLHPIAFAFRRAFEGTEVLPVEGAREVPGQGVSGYLFGHYYEVKGNRVSHEGMACTLFENNRPVIDFQFSARLKPGARKTLDVLRTQGLRVVLLSGDRGDAVASVAQELGFEAGDVHYGLSPSEKAAIVAQTPGAMMVGDGVNDSLALLRAQVGIAVSGGVEAALRSSDVYLVEPSLRGVEDLLRISHSGIGLIKQNLIISLLYNTCGGALALAGYINPFVAAVLMPVSSGFILLSTWWRGRG